MPKASAPDALVAYVPVVHRGYVEFFRQYGSVNTLFILGTDILVEEDYLRKELRAIMPEEAAEAVKSLGIFKDVKVLNKPELFDLDKPGFKVVMPDEDIGRHVAERYLTKADVTFYPVFLRWDRRNVEGVNRDAGNVKTSRDKTDIQYMHQAFAEADKSPDIWRRVGAVVVKDDICWKASNQPMTTQNTPWAEGDPRGVFTRGIGIEMSTFFHAEASLIARAARMGTSLLGATIYVTTFPCPPCAMLVAGSGIKRCCFGEGYAMLDGQRVMTESGVELVRIEGDFTSDSRTLITYKEKKNKPAA